MVGEEFALLQRDAAVGWTLVQPGISAICATTFPWHHASLKVISKLGMVRVGEREHDMLGPRWIFERRASGVLRAAPALRSAAG